VNYDRAKVAEEFARIVEEQKMSDEEALANFKRKRKSDYRWLMEDGKGNKQHPTAGTFRWCCIEFDLDPEIVRQRVREARKGKST
jgi:hypothetical protein